ncbi:MAG: protein kinase [Oscillospiraceae bacterium]|nr:protein kinase [Oscillospiraceae bacterium]
MSELKLCFGCMEALNGESVCPYCGHDQNAASLVNYLKPGSILHDRYMIGKVFDSNGEGVTYVGYDQSVECKVLIREYFPERLCSRNVETGAVDVSGDNLAQYKALKAEFTELNKALARMRDISHLYPALDMFAENNTNYVVYEFQEGGTMLEYLKENAGELSWDVVERIFPPLFTTLSLLHNAGVLHRGLSPETIFVTEKGEIKLSGFCISAARTNDTELDAELFDGYAAPEQYYADRQQGTWTDVYGISAVLYRILTGCRATDSNSRQDYDILVPPSELNPQVPEHVSSAIMKGLELDSTKRVRTINDLVTLLFSDDNAEENRKGDTAVYDARAAVAASRSRNQPPSRNGQQNMRRQSQNGGQRNYNSRQSNQRRSQNGGRGRDAQYYRERSGRPQYGRSYSDREMTLFERVRAPLLIAFLFIVILTIVIIAFSKIWGMSNQKHMANSKDKETSAADNVVPSQTDPGQNEVVPDAYIPNLVGKSFSIKRDEMAGWLDLEPIFEFSDIHMKDTIFQQEFEPDSEFVSGSSMKVWVSLGSSILSIPDYEGQRLQPFLKKLQDMGFVVATNGGNDNSVTFSNSMGGTTKPNSNNNNYVVTTNSEGKSQTVIYKAKVDYNYTNGYVCGIDPPPMTIVDALGDYYITVYYAYNPINETYINGSGTSTTSNKKKTTGKETSTTKTTVTKTNEEAERGENQGEDDPPSNPVTEAPVTQAPVTQAPVTQAPATFPPATNPPAQNDPT